MEIKRDLSEALDSADTATQSGNQILYFHTENLCIDHPGSDETFWRGPADGDCWWRIRNIPDCYFANVVLPDYWAAHWSGRCDASGNAHGAGQLTWRDPNSTQSGAEGEQTGIGEFFHGKAEGHWRFEFNWTSENRDYETWSEGSFVDGKRQGHWVEKDGPVSEGPYVDGKRHGHWVRRSPDGTRIFSEGQCVEGKIHGSWTTRHPDGEVEYESHNGEQDC